MTKETKNAKAPEAPEANANPTDLIGASGPEVSLTAPIETGTILSNGGMVWFAKAELSGGKARDLAFFAAKIQKYVNKQEYHYHEFTRFVVCDGMGLYHSTYELVDGVVTGMVEKGYEGRMIPAPAKGWCLRVLPTKKAA